MIISKSKSFDSILCLNFNQDSTLFGVGLSHGFQIFHADPLKLRKRIDFQGDRDVWFVELLFQCSILGLVCNHESVNDRKRLIIWDENKSSQAEKQIIDMKLTCGIVGLRLRRDRIIVILENQIKIYTLDRVPKLLEILETSTNPNGICSLSSSSSNSILAFPSTTTGVVNLLNLSASSHGAMATNDSSPGAGGECQGGAVSSIKAHESRLAAIVLDKGGHRLGTASEKGTIIRVYDTKTLDPVCEFRRGTHRASIFCLAFNSSSDLLCCSSDHSTVHIFQLPKSSDSPTFPRARSNSDAGNGSGTSPNQKNFGQNAKNKLFKILHQPQTSTSFCKIEIPSSTSQHLQSIVTFGTEPNCLIVLRSDGFYFKFVFDRETGHFTREVTKRFLEEK